MWLNLFCLHDQQNTRHANVPLSSRREAASGQREGRQRPLISDSSSDEDGGATAESMVDEATETGKHSGLSKGRRGVGVKIKGEHQALHASTPTTP